MSTYGIYTLKQTITSPLRPPTPPTPPLTPPPPPPPTPLLATRVCALSYRDLFTSQSALYSGYSGPSCKQYRVYFVHSIVTGYSCISNKYDHHTQTLKHAHTHTYTHIHTHTRIHTHIYTHTHTYIGV